MGNGNKRNRQLKRKKSKTTGKGKGKGRGRGSGKKNRSQKPEKKSKASSKKKLAKEAKKAAKKIARKQKKLTKKLKQRARKNQEPLGRKNTKASNATVNLTCLTTVIQLLKFQKDNVNNFLSRHTRQIKQNALTTKKQGKKGEFAEPAARLIQSGGGNKSNLICGGSTNSTGAKQLLNLTNLLDGCS